MKIRFKFRKQGDLRFIGHLDVMRYYQKVFRRAGLDMAFTGGYSPHMIMTFAAPLGLGLTSEGEYMDAEFVTVPGKDELIARMNAVSVPDLTVVDACLLPDDAKNAMASLLEADYTVRFREEYPESEDFFDAFFTWLQSDKICIEKKTKKSTTELDLKPLIRHFERNGNAISMRVSQGSENNLKPELLLAVFLRGNGTERFGLPKVPEGAEEIPESWIRTVFAISRDEMYTLDAGVTKPMIEMGERTF
ncbi:MAG: DUF2344 domain-containing protein [Lachnospiraceae bacterium]|nr:DUF2344 domain-containing protein [Lachnospiraceae bacterium]